MTLYARASLPPLDPRHFLENLGAALTRLFQYNLFWLNRAWFRLFLDYFDLPQSVVK